MGGLGPGPPPLKSALVKVQNNKWKRQSLPFRLSALFLLSFLFCSLLTEECRSVVQLATGITYRKSLIGRVGEDPREDVGVGFGVVECGLKCRHAGMRE